MARPGLRNHPKFRRLVHLLDEPVPHVLGYLELLWATAYECGNPRIGDATDIELAAEYPGDPGKLFDALLKCGGEGRAGFIEAVSDEPNAYQVHDLFDHAPDYVQKRRKREIQREHSGEARKKAFAPRRRNLTAEWRQADDNGRVCQTVDDLGRLSQPVADLGETPAPAPAPSPPNPHGGNGRAPTRMAAAASTTAAFDRFWDAYPRKVSKQAAIKAWTKLQPDETQLAAMLTALERHKRSAQWIKDDGQFVPHPATWLNGRRWEDDPVDGGCTQRLLSHEEFLSGGDA